MNPAAPTRERSELESGFGLGRSAWLAFALVLARAGVVVLLELAHHGDRELAGLRLAHAYWPLAVGGLGIALAAAFGAWGAGLTRARPVRVGVALGLALVIFLFLGGQLDRDPSRRIGTHTPLGLAALAAAALTAAALAALFLRGSGARWSLVRSGRGALLPLALLALGGVYLHQAHTGLPPSMAWKQVEHELAREAWQVLSARAEAPPSSGILAPSAEYSERGAGRPALLLAPPARVRRVVPASAGVLWLVGGAAVDHSVAEEAAARYPGHVLRFRVHVDGKQAFEARVPLAGADEWADFGRGAGLELPPEAVLELETALLDGAGNEVVPPDPLRAGFGALELERRGRAPRTRASPAAPNLVLIVLDTLRADRTSAYGHGRATTPHLSALAQRGVLFEDISATASWTWPSTASLFTGLFPEQHGVLDAASSFLPRELDTLAEALQRAGFTTAAWSGSPLIVPDKHFDQGFEFFDASAEGRMRRSNIVLPGALEWLGAAREWRFFLYLHLMEPHAPYVPLEEGRRLFAPDVPRSFDPRKTVDYSWDLKREGFTAQGEPRLDELVRPEEQRWIEDLYDGCVWSADHWLGVLLARLAQLGLEENTLVVVTSDHGEELFEHGLLAHGHGLHRELVRVPLVMAGPGLPQGERVRAPFSSVAVAPTLARLLGAELTGLDASVDLFAPRAEPMLFSTRHGWWNGVEGQALYGLRVGQEVLHFAPAGGPWGQGPAAGGEVRLYDLDADPAEREDLAPRDPQRAHDLRAELLLRLEALEARRVHTGGSADEGTLDVLRALGYIGK